MLKKSVLIQGLRIHIASAFIIGALLSGNAQGEVLQINRQLLYDSFFLKKAPISGVIAVLSGNNAVIRFDKMKVGKHISKGAVTLIKKEEFQLDVRPSGRHKTDSNYITLIVPFGSKCRLRLPDNTFVVMQVGSSLRFAPVFTRTERRVELNGCAYFEIAKGDPRPFIIQTRRLTMKAHTSQVGVEDYLDESSPSVTLEPGANKDTSGNNKTIEILAEQSAENECDHPARYNINVGNQLLWKVDYFSFDGSLNIKQALRIFAEAYRMHVVFEDNLKDGPFGWGEIQSDLPLERLLKVLELPNLHFEIRTQDSTIIVKGA